MFDLSENSYYKRTESRSSKTHLNHRTRAIQFLFIFSNYTSETEDAEWKVLTTGERRGAHE